MESARRDSDCWVEQETAKRRLWRERTAILPDRISARYTSFHHQPRSSRDGVVVSRVLKSPPFMVAPDAFVPNSSLRTVFRRKVVKTPEVKEFRLRLDILKNLQVVERENSDVSDEISENASSVGKAAKDKKLKVTLMSHTKVSHGLSAEDTAQNKHWNKDTMPPLFRRLQNEPWWKQTKSEQPNLISMLLQLTEVIKLKRTDSYESACAYLIEIFRTFGIEPLFVSQNLDILARHLSTNEKDTLNVCTVRTIAQFMIEQKDLIVQLLEYALNFQPASVLWQETVNAVKFITDIGSQDDIQLALDNLAVVQDAPEDNFSLKAVIQAIASMPEQPAAEVVNDEQDNNEIHPLLKKIAKERWFPRQKIPITLDYVLQAIILNLSEATKALVKTLTTHLIELSRKIGYSEGQFERVSEALISLLSHVEADVRLIAATKLADLRRETKSIDIALLNSYMNDPRILVRTECCDALKLITGITSDTVLKDCAEDIAALQTLPAQNFTLQNYWARKNRPPTPAAAIEPPPSLAAVVEEPPSIIEPEETRKTPVPLPTPRSPSPQIAEPVVPVCAQPAVNRLKTPTKSIDPIPTPPIEQPKTNPIQTSIAVQVVQRRPSISTVTTNTVHSFTLRNQSPVRSVDGTFEDTCHSPSQTTILSDAIQTILEEHQRVVGFYRMAPPRPILVPHKITLEHIFSDQSHLLVDQRSIRLPPRQGYTFSTHLNSSQSMSFLNFSQNQRTLHETESVQLLSSLVVRAIQIHRNHDRLLPGASAASITDVLSISPMLPPRLTSKPYPHVQMKASRDGVDIHKARGLQGAFSHLLKTHVEPTALPPPTSSVTHGWILLQLLKSQGVAYSESYLQRIMHAYPRFLPLLYTGVPQRLIATIWNDPMMKHIASMFSDKRDYAPIDSPTLTNSQTISMPTITDAQSTSSIDQLELLRRMEPKKRFLPPLRQSTLDLPNLVITNSSRELEMNAYISSTHSMSTESKPRFRRRRCYIHSMLDHQDSLKSRSGTMWKTDARAVPLLPTISRVTIRDLI